MKLTNTTRERIAEAATAFAFDPKQKALSEAENTLAREAYATIFPAKEVALVEAIPKNWVRRDSCLTFNVGGQRITLRMDGDGLPVPYRIGEYAGYSCSTLGSILPGDLCDRIQAHALTVERTKAERRDAYRKVLAMLGSVTTIKRLRETWPEGEQFYAKYETAPAPSVPAIRVDEINAALGLAA